MMNDKLIKELEQLFDSRGFNVIMGDMYKQQDKWENWYRGNVNDFHYYSIQTVSGKSEEIYKGSLQMPKKACEDWASLLWNSECQLKTSDPSSQDRLNSILVDNDFGEEIHGFIERTFSNGTGVMVEYIADDKVQIDFVYGNAVVILDYHNTTIKDIAIIQEFKVDNRLYRHIQYHTFKNELYRIEHEIYQKGNKKELESKVSLEVLFSEEEINGMRHIEVDETTGEQYERYYVEYETSFAHFQILKPAMVNNFDLDHPMGVAVFANAIKPSEGIDDAYYSLTTEDINTRKHVYVSDEGTKVQKTKEQTANGAQVKLTRYFNRDDTLHRSMKMPENKPVEAYGPEHNGISLIDSLNQHLNVFGFRCGFGTNFYSFKDGQVYVNEKNVTSSNMDLFNARQKHLMRLKSVLFKMMYAILFLDKQLGNYTGDLNLDYEVVTDDSILEDDNALIERYVQYAQSGWIPAHYAVARGLNISLDEAKTLVEEQDKADDLEFQKIIGGPDEQVEED